MILPGKATFTFTRAFYYAKTYSGSDDRMNQLSLASGNTNDDTNECQDEFWSLYIHSRFSVYRTICHVPLTLAAEFWSIDRF